MAVKKNILANYLGQGWYALMGLAFIPFYIKYLGMEAYGLIGIFASLQAWLSMLDMGLAPTLNREMARFSAGAHTFQSIRDLLRTLEIIYGLLISVLAISIYLLAPWFAENWLKVENLSLMDVSNALAMMGIVVTLRWYEGLYKGALQGLQKMVWLNIALAFLATIRWGGAAVVLAWISPSIQLFFLWQGAVSILTAGIFAIGVYKSLPKTGQTAHFSRIELLKVWKFSGGLLLITFLALLLTQVDKIILSHLLSLEAFGYYSLAVIIGNALFQLIYPLANAMYPRFTELSTQGKQEELAKIYHRANQLMSVVIIPPVLVLIFFPEIIISLWTQNIDIANNVTPIIVPLVLGTLLNGFMNLPYMLQLAHGWVRFAVVVNCIAVMFIIPAIFLVVPDYGAEGAAYVWLILNAGYVFIAIHFMHRRLLPKEKWSWYFNDIFKPLGVASLVSWMAWWMFPIGMSISMLENIMWLITTIVIVWMTTLLVSSQIRNVMMRYISFNL